MSAEEGRGAETIALDHTVDEISLLAKISNFNVFLRIGKLYKSDWLLNFINPQTILTPKGKIGLVTSLDTTKDIKAHGTDTL